MGKERINIRKLVDCQFALQGTEKDIEVIIKKICDISKYEEVSYFGIHEK